MADPFSIVAGAIGVADACIRLTQNIQQLQRDYVSVQDELNTLGGDILSLRNFCVTIETTFREGSESLATIHPKTGAHQSERLLWHLKEALDNCGKVISQLNDVVTKIRGNADPSTPSTLDVLGMAMRKKSRQDDLQNCRAQLATYQSALQLVLSTITFHDMKHSQNSNDQSFRDLSHDVQRLDSNLQMRIASLRQTILSTDSPHFDMTAVTSLEELRESVGAGSASLQPPQQVNHHFDIPQSVSSIFTGRERELRELRDLLIPKDDNTRDTFQRRFIIHGLGGSGKTQFCCKFAEENRDSFWGVFWIDASTSDRIKQTLCAISETANVDKNEHAALNWLSNLDHQWLLIVDNADDESIPLDLYFPKGNRGTVLVTTRNRGYKFHGNVGPRFYSFHGLDLDEATELLLRASDQPVPWDIASKSLASTISKVLGSLALAIIHAGAAIRDKLCSLEDYLAYYERSYKRLRQLMPNQSGSSSEASVHATWEICYERLENKGSQAALDAMEILNILAFFHWEIISPEIFIRALRNPDLESAMDADAKNNPTSPSWIATSATWIRSIPASLLMLLFGSTSPPALPRVLRGAAQHGAWEDAEDRIRFALKELDQMSLIISNDHSDSYAMHPIIHVWARERPKMKLADQALWADVAGRVLAASILLPPLGTSEQDEKYHVSLLLHVKHVQACRISIASTMSAKRQSATSSVAWLSSLILTTWAPDTDMIRMYAKFSVVYAKCGHWASAEPLLVDVWSFLHRHLGPAHSRSRRVALFLATVYWHMGEMSRAAALQASVLETCKAHLGLSHPETLGAMGELARTRWQQGQYSAARDLQEVVLKERLIYLPHNHEDTLDAMDNLGLTVQKFWEIEDLERACKLHSDAADGMAKILGREHARTLVARENQCRVAVLLGGQHAESVVNKMREIMETRKRTLGKQHPYTLLAMANMAIVLSAMGRLDEAEDLIRGGLPVAQQNLGPDHIGTLFGEHTLACVLLQKGQYAEAERMLIHVTEKQRHMSEQLGAHHPDRLGSLIELARCFHRQGKISPAIAICDEAIKGFEAISTVVHPLARQLAKARSYMNQQLERPDASLNDHVAFPCTLWRFDE